MSHRLDLVDILIRGEDMLKDELTAQSDMLDVFRGDVVPPSNLLQQFSKSFLQDVNLGVLLIDDHYRLIAISDKACLLLGWQRDDVLNCRVNQLFKDLPSEHHFIQRSLLEGTVVRNHGVSWVNGAFRYDLLMDSNVLRDESDGIVGAYVILKDITSLRSSEEQIRRNDCMALVGQIAAGTAHEIRNPLTAVKGFIQMFKRSFTACDMHKELEQTELILQEIKRIDGVVSQFLLLSKPKHVVVERVGIQQLWDELLSDVSTQWNGDHIRFQYECKPPVYSFMTDRLLFKQVLLNLISNAIDAMDGKGEVAIRVRADEDSKLMLISVCDSGPGIPVYAMDKIFDPFYTTKAENVGLGLAVCQRIVHDIGGMIRVSSKGYGTTFTVVVPY